VAVFVCGRSGCGRFGLGPFWMYTISEIFGGIYRLFPSNPKGTFVNVVFSGIIGPIFIKVGQDGANI